MFAGGQQGTPLLSPIRWNCYTNNLLLHHISPLRLGLSDEYHAQEGFFAQKRGARVTTMACGRAAQTQAQSAGEVPG